MASLQHIIIVGAGPAGLLLALLLAKANIRVSVLEKESQPTDETRAVFYQPVSFFEFKRAGVFDDVQAAAFHPRSACWRDMDGKRLFGISGGGMVALTLNKLAAIVHDHISGEKDATILWNHNVVRVGQDDTRAWVDVETPDGSKRMEGSYIVGCDGATSVVRRSLFGEKAMPGFTWDKQLVAADVRYDFSALEDLEDSNLFMHPQDSWIAFRPSQEENLWRIIYREDSDLTDHQILARSPAKIESLFPGHPKRGQCEICRIRPYKIHQRLVDNMRCGRVILASDAAHLCCPYGAFGLNGGIADVGSLYDCLIAIHEGKASESILDIYSNVRREKWKTIIDPQSQNTMKLLFSDPNYVIPNHPFYKFVEVMTKNPEMARKNAPDPLALRYDFSIHFDAPGL